MAPNPDRRDFLFGMVLALAVATTWAVLPNAESDSAEPIRPSETLYRPEYWRAFSANSPRLPQDRLRGLGCCLGAHGPPVGTNHCKFLSSHPRVPDDGRDRAVDGGSQEVEPLRPSGRDYDPDRLSPRLAGVRIVRSAMVAGRAGHRPATRPQGEERLAECPPDAGRRDTRAAAPAARTGAVLARLHD